MITDDINYRNGQIITPKNNNGGEIKINGSQEGSIFYVTGGSTISNKARSANCSGGVSERSTISNGTFRRWAASDFEFHQMTNPRHLEYGLLHSFAEDIKVVL